MQIGIFKPAEHNNPWDACYLICIPNPDQC